MQPDEEVVYNFCTELLTNKQVSDQTFQATKEKFGWKFYTYNWSGATPGEHTIVSRATDVNGLVQPTADDLKSKRSFLETNSQVPRKVRIG